MTSAGSVTAGTPNTPTVINTSKFSGGSYSRGAFSGGSFTQGTDNFTAASLQSGFYTAGTANVPTAVTLPGRSSAINVWTGVTQATAAAQVFTGTPC